MEVLKRKGLKWDHCKCRLPVPFTATAFSLSVPAISRLSLLGSGICPPFCCPAETDAPMALAGDNAGMSSPPAVSLLLVSRNKDLPHENTQFYNSNRCVRLQCICILHNFLRYLKAKATILTKVSASTIVSTVMTSVPSSTIRHSSSSHSLESLNHPDSVSVILTLLFQLY